MALVELLVRMDCTGCERRIRKELSKLKGVNSVDVDLRTGKVTVFGNVDRRKVLNKVRNSGKRAEFWQESFNRLEYDYPSNTYNDDIRSYQANGSSGHHDHQPSSYTGNHVLLNQHAFKRTYNYEKHGYNPYHYDNDDDATPSYASNTMSHQYDSTPTLFSDDNPNACSIM